MGKKQTKLLVIGIDQALPYFINKFLTEGLLPNIKNLVNNGVIGEAYPCPPCDTPTNWTTIATGATTAIHGVTSFYMHVPGDSFELGLNYRSRTQLVKYCKAEYLWDVADRNSMASFIFNYPSGWASKLKRGVMGLYTWEIPESFPRMIAPSKTYKLDIGNEGDGERKLLLPIKSKEITDAIEKEVFLTKTRGKNYDALKILITPSNNWQILKSSVWSNWIEVILNTTKGLLPCLFKIKVQELNSKNNYVKIKRTAIYNKIGWTYPENFGEKLIKNVFEFDLPESHDVEFMIYESMKKYLRSAREESLTLAQTVNFAKKDMNWDICFFHYHLLDSINHDSLAFLYNKSPLYNEEEAEKSLENEETAYKIVDELVGEVLKSSVDKNTIICFVSDHGAIPIWKMVNLPKFFMKAGLIKYKWNFSENGYKIDWRRTKAYPYMEPPFIWINLEGRDPFGIVKQKEYEDLKYEIIEILYDMRDPYTNEKLVDLALKKEDSDYLGLNGERIGDIIYFLKPSYGLFDGNLGMLNASFLSKNLYEKPEIYDSQVFFGAHAYFLPSTKLGDFSITAPLILSGPGIKQGEKLESPVNLIDLAPTLSQLLQIPNPKDSQGRILNEILS